MKTPNTNTNISTYNGIDIQQEINTYTSKYWLEYNHQYVCDSYNEFRKSFDDTEVRLQIFELLMFFHMFNLWKHDNGRETITNEYLNLYTKNNDYQVRPNEIMILKQSYEKSPEIRKMFVDEVLKLIIPIPIEPQKVYTQEELNNYADILF